MSPANTYGQRVYHACRERSEIEYLQARKRHVADPVILLDTRNQDERRERLARQREFPENMEMAHLAVVVGSRQQIAQQLANISQAAAEDTRFILLRTNAGYPLRCFELHQTYV
jgi:alkanesulfonate monooxygenase SsuD/methylene tetrahydromethanopterin reductase-like flavin-dependent oxidoreductase (luciferase family)